MDKRSQNGSVATGAATVATVATNRKRPTDAEIVHRLIAIKLMVAGMKDAMPSAAASMRREVCEGIDDLIGEIGR